MELLDVMKHEWISLNENRFEEKQCRLKEVVSCTKARNVWLADNQIIEIRKLTHVREGKSYEETWYKLCELSHMLAKRLPSELWNLATITETTYYLPQDTTIEVMRSVLTEQLGDEGTAGAVADYISRVFEEAAVFEKPRKSYTRKSPTPQE